MRIGLQLPSFSWPGGTEAIAPRLGEIAHGAEEAGFTSLWVMDHFFQVPPWRGPDQPMLEAYATLGYLAARTNRIRLGALVGGVIYRHPGILLKTMTTLDVLCGGRAYWGIGASWYEREALGLGVPYPPQAERFEWLEEMLQIAHQMWSGDVTPFHGAHFRLDEPLNNPLPLARPHPPIMIGGNGERRTLKLVARYADACNLLVPDPGESRHKFEVLKHHCDDVGRDYAEIERTTLIEVRNAPGRMTSSEIVALCREQEAEGVQHVIVNLPDAHDPAVLAMFGREIIPAIRG
jgi:F420-dependent oxidoreductase-like protein